MSDSFVTPGTVACQVPVSMGFPRQEYWSGLPFSSPRDLPNAGIKPMSPALADRFPTTQSPGKSLTGCWQCLRSEFEVSGWSKGNTWVLITLRMVGYEVWRNKETQQHKCMLYAHASSPTLSSSAMNGSWPSFREPLGSLLPWGPSGLGLLCHSFSIPGRWVK